MTRQKFKKSKVINSNEDELYDWLVMPDTYLATALLICRKIPVWLFPHDIVGRSSVFRELHFKSHHSDYELIHPIIFNFKHGIELYIKGLGNLAYGEYINNHDLKALFNFILKKAENNDQKKYKILKQLHQDTWHIIKKYYYGTYNPKIKNENYPDKNNIAKKYPEVNDKTYKIQDAYKYVTKELLNQIEKDIRIIENKFSEAQRKIYSVKYSPEERKIRDRNFLKKIELSLEQDYKIKTQNKK